MQGFKTVAIKCSLSYHSNATQRSGGQARMTGWCPQPRLLEINVGYVCFCEQQTSRLICWNFTFLYVATFQSFMTHYPRCGLVMFNHKKHLVWEKHILIYEVHGTQTQLEMSLMSGKNTWFCAQNMANYLTSSKMASNRFILKTVVSHSSHHHHPSSSLDVKSAPARLIWIWYDTFCRHVDMICTECINQPKCSVSVDNRNIQLHFFFPRQLAWFPHSFSIKL